MSGARERQIGAAQVPRSGVAFVVRETIQSIPMTVDEAVSQTGPGVGFEHSPGELILTTGERDGAWVRVLTSRGLVWTSKYYFLPRFVEELS